ncbi:MAG: SixA phosphatase family protein [Gemmatimonadota bacterium]
MRLLLIRHAIAVEREEFASTGEDDSLRPLTREGRFKMRRAAAGLKRTVSRLDLLATSPWVRAVQTAEIIAKAYRGLAFEETDVLLPAASNAAFLEWLAPRTDHEYVAAVGHEPHLGRLASWLLAGTDTSFIQLRKGGAICIEFGDEVGRAKGLLAWSLPPAELRKMARD